MYPLHNQAWPGWEQWLAFALGCIAVHLQVTSALRFARPSRLSPTFAALAFLISAWGGLWELRAPVGLVPLPEQYGQARAHFLAVALAACFADLGYGLAILVFCRALSALLGGCDLDGDAVDFRAAFGPQSPSSAGALARRGQTTLVRATVGCFLVIAAVYALMTADFNGPLGVIKARLGPSFMLCPGP